VCLYNGVWHQIAHNSNTGLPKLLHSLTSIHTFDIEEETSKEQEDDSDKEPKGEESDSDSDLAEQTGQLNIDNQIRETEIPRELTPRRNSVSLPRHTKFSPISPKLSTMATSSITIQQPTDTQPITQGGGDGSSSKGKDPASGTAGTGNTTTMATTGTAASVNSKLKASLSRYSTPGGGRSGPPSGGPPSGGSGGPGGNPPGAPGPPAPVPPAQGGQQPIARAADVKSMGGLPQVFSGNRLLADDFIEEVKGYLRLNQDVAGYNSPIKKVALTLTLMKGPQVAGWTHDMGTWLDTLDPVLDNIPDIWDQFLFEFSQQYQDSQRENRARGEIEHCTMKFPEIDDYIARFEDLARIAGYDANSGTVFQLFTKGLPDDILKEVLTSPTPQTYVKLKEKAISSTRSKVLINNILRARNPNRGTGGFNRGVFNTFPRPSNFQRPRTFFSQGGQGNQGGFLQQRGPGFRQGPPPAQYNSTNAPHWMNNVAVPMDLGCTRAPNWRQGNRGRMQGNTTNFGPAPRNNTTRPPRGTTNNACFECGQTGHFARNCPCCRQGRTGPNLIDFNEEYNNYEGFETPNCVDEIKQQLNAMSLDEKAKLAEEMGVAEDFPTA